MKSGKLPLMAAGTLGCALTIGAFMDSLHNAQSGSAVSTQDIGRQARNGIGQKRSLQALPIEEITLTSSSPEDQIEPDRGLPARASLQLPTELEVPRFDCQVQTKLTPVQSGFVTLHVDAPCHENETLTLHHAGIIISEQLDAEGTLSTILPALTETVTVIVSFDTGGGAEVTTYVPDLNAVEHVVLQWDRSPVFSLHAREFGAGYGDEGHVWVGATVNPTRNGYLVRIGNADVPNPQIVEVYSYHREDRDTAGRISLSVEAEVTVANCGQSVHAQSVERRHAMPMRTRDLQFQMPDCGDIGTFLVLNNIMDDLTIVAN